MPLAMSSWPKARVISMTRRSLGVADGRYNAERAPLWRRSFWSTEHGRRCEPLVCFPGEPVTRKPDCPSPPAAEPIPTQDTGPPPA